MTEYFDYESLAKEIGLSAAQLDVIKRGIRSDYPHDDMLFELHVLRACMVIKNGDATYEQVVRSLPGHATAA